MAAANNPSNQKMQNLPLLCVESIFKFTPTSKFIRLCSIAVPLPGASWNLGLETVLRKRFPLALRDVRGFRLSAKAIYDVSGAKVATIKQPKAFCFSPIREFIERSTLSVEVVRLAGASFQFYVVHGDALLSHLPNVVHLELIVHDTEGHCEAKDLLEPCLKHLLPRLQSLFISHQFYGYTNVRRQVDQAFVVFVTSVRKDELFCLRRLALPVTEFDSLMRAAADKASPLQSVLAGLNSLAIEHDVNSMRYSRLTDLSFIPALNFAVLSCKQLSQLKVDVRGKFSAYLAAFRELPRLNSLALDVCETDLAGLTFDGRYAIDLVSHLRIIFLPFTRCPSPPTIGGVLKIATFFPNVKLVEVMANCEPNPLELASSLFGQAQLFAAAAKLSCLHPHEYFSCPNERLMQFLANPRLPEAVDLSQIIFDGMARDAGLLTGIYCTMQSNSIKSLLLSGPVHRGALSRLQGHFDFNGEYSTKISAWKDRDLGDQQPGVNFSAEISEQTDLKIVGNKTSGSLKDEEFTIRVFHKLAKRGTGSWYFAMK